jgi:hypothetical protein
MIFFDLEMYVPLEQRDSRPKGTMIFNPGKSTDLLLGGYFISKATKVREPNSTSSFWLWNYDHDEKKLLMAIIEYFKKEWELQQKEKATVLNKRVRDLVTCGLGIGRMDLPTLFIRSQEHQILSTAELFDIFMKTRVIDLGQVACFLFPKEKVLYPKTANELTRVLQIGTKLKPSGKNVWDLYDDKKFGEIESRCQQEVDDILEMYYEIKNRMQ